MEEKRSFLDKLQSADEATKKRLMIAGTIFITIAVVYVWLAYFNNLIAGFSQTAPVAQADDLSVWQNIKNNFTIFSASIIDKVHVFGNILSAPREYIIKPPR